MQFTVITTPPQLYGDVDKNGVVDGFDALEILNYEAQLINLLTPESKDTFEHNPQIADLNGDNYVDSFDALEILNYEAQLYNEISAAAKVKLGIQ